MAQKEATANEGSSYASDDPDDSNQNSHFPSSHSSSPPNRFFLVFFSILGFNVSLFAGILAFTRNSGMHFTTSPRSIFSRNKGVYYRDIPYTDSIVDVQQLLDHLRYRKIENYFTAFLLK